MFKQGARARWVVLAVVVLLMSMAGSATAGALITGKQIKDGSVAGRDIKNESLSGADVKDGSLNSWDFNGSLQGPAGPPGPQGPAGVAGIQYPVQEMSVPAQGHAAADVLCPAGTKVGGGGVSSTAHVSVRVEESAPLNEGAGWTAAVYNYQGSAISAYVWAACVVVS